MIVNDDFNYMKETKLMDIKTEKQAIKFFQVKIYCNIF